MARKDASINLVVENVSFFDRFINWALTVGRVIVILTELIALLAFLYRFSLDQQLIDLHAKIKQEQAVVEYLKDNEDTFRNIQNRIALASTLGTSSKQNVKIVNDVISFAPPGMTFNELSDQDGRLKINASTISVSSLSEFVNKLRSYPEIKSVIVEKIENRTSSASIALTITAVLKSNAKTN